MQKTRLRTPQLDEYELLTLEAVSWITGRTAKATLESLIDLLRKSYDLPPHPDPNYATRPAGAGFRSSRCISLAEISNRWGGMGEAIKNYLPLDGEDIVKAVTTQSAKGRLSAPDLLTVRERVLKMSGGKQGLKKTHGNRNLAPMKFGLEKDEDNLLRKIVLEVDSKLKSPTKKAGQGEDRKTDSD